MYVLSHLQLSYWSDNWPYFPWWAAKLIKIYIQSHSSQYMTSIPSTQADKYRSRIHIIELTVNQLDIYTDRQTLTWTYNTNNQQCILISLFSCKKPEMWSVWFHHWAPSLGSSVGETDWTCDVLHCGKANVVSLPLVFTLWLSLERSSRKVTYHSRPYTQRHMFENLWYQEILTYYVLWIAKKYGHWKIYNW